jgi:hypothetical protein
MAKKISKKKLILIELEIENSMEKLNEFKKEIAESDIGGLSHVLQWKGRTVQEYEWRWRFLRQVESICLHEENWRTELTKFRDNMLKNDILRDAGNSTNPMSNMEKEAKLNAARNVYQFTWQLLTMTK